MDRYVQGIFIGDGRVFNGARSMTRERTGVYLVRCPVLPGAERMKAADLPMDFALSDKHDLMAEKAT